MKVRQQTIILALVAFMVALCVFAAQAKSAAPQGITDPQDPAYWGLKKGEYIPGPGCITGSWGRKKYAFEVCVTVTYL